MIHKTKFILLSYKVVLFRMHKEIWVLTVKHPADSCLIKTIWSYYR